MEHAMLEALMLAKTAVDADTRAESEATTSQALSDIKLQTQNMGQTKATDLHPTLWSCCSKLMRGETF